MLRKLLFLLLLTVLKAGVVTAQEFDWVRKVGIKTAESEFPSPETWALDPKAEADPYGSVILSGNFKDTLVFETQAIISKSGVY